MMRNGTSRLGVLRQSVGGKLWLLLIQIYRKFSSRFSKQHARVEVLLFWLSYMDGRGFPAAEE